MRISCLCLLAVCSTPCQNNGTCVAPNVCQCKILADISVLSFTILSIFLLAGPTGYTGDNCQERMY